MRADSLIVEEVRKRRSELSERFRHDIHAYYEHLREVQDKYQSRIVNQLTVVSPKKQEPIPNKSLPFGNREFKDLDRVPCEIFLILFFAFLYHPIRFLYRVSPFSTSRRLRP